MAGDIEEQNCVGERERKPQKETGLQTMVMERESREREGVGSYFQGVVFSATNQEMSCFFLDTFPAFVC